MDNVWGFKKQCGEIQNRATCFYFGVQHKAPTATLLGYIGCFFAITIGLLINTMCI